MAENTRRRWSQTPAEPPQPWMLQERTWGYGEGYVRVETWASWAATTSGERPQHRRPEWRMRARFCCASAVDRRTGEEVAGRVASRAEGGVQHCASRSTCSVLGRILRWCSSADAQAPWSLGGGSLRPLLRHKKGHPKLRRGSPLVDLAGHVCWDSAEGWQRKTSGECVVAALPSPRSLLPVTGVPTVRVA